MRVTLNGIKRRGLTKWADRLNWIGRPVAIYSGQHRAWWRWGACGYTDDINQAGEWKFEDAYDRTKHCGPEKRIEFISMGTRP